MSFSRTIPPALQAHLDSGATTITWLIKLMPVTPGYDPLGITLLDRDVVYDDGDGALTYSARVGVIPSSLELSEQMDVDNTELQHLIPDPEFDVPLTERELTAGVLDFAKYIVYLVNYEDLTMGSVPIAYGELGQITVKDGLSFYTEMTGLSKKLKQSIVQVYSILCRATYGSQPIGTGGGVIEEKYPCGKDVSADWVNFTVTSVGAEENRTFYATGLTQADGFFTPGMVQWATGDNADTQIEVENFFHTGGQVDLLFETKFPIQVGDTGKIRSDCTKWKDGTNGCKAHWGGDWKLHYRGEPFIPIADGDQINTPGATVSVNMGGQNTSGTGA